MNKEDNTAKSRLVELSSYFSKKRTYDIQTSIIINFLYSKILK